MAILGVDVSENQLRELPWGAWHAQGLRFVIGRASIGYRQDALYPFHLQQAAAAGFECRGAYHAILHHDSEIAFFDPVRQADVFVGRLIPGLTTLSVLDIEAAGVTEPMIRAWCDRYDARCSLPLLLYGNTALNTLLASNPARYINYGKWVSDYGYFAPGTKAPPQRSEPFSVAGIPRVPAVAGPLRLWQFAGDNGRRLPYTWRIDLDVFAGSEAELRALFGVGVLPEKGKVKVQYSFRLPDSFNVAEALTRLQAAFGADLLEPAVTALYDIATGMPSLVYPPLPPAPWWESWPAGAITPARKLKATGRTIKIYKADGVTPATAPRVQAGEWDVFERHGGLLKVYDPAGEAGDWWVLAKDVEPK